jgi:hypothetical protein
MSSVASRVRGRGISFFLIAAPPCASQTDAYPGRRKCAARRAPPSLPPWARGRQMRVPTSAGAVTLAPPPALPQLLTAMRRV